MRWFRRVFGFEKIPVTVVTLTCYLAALVAVIVQHEHMPGPPRWATKRNSSRLGLNLDNAWDDLQAIASVPHPFNSHENDDVHDYLWKRLTAIKSSTNSTFMTLDDDSITNLTSIRGNTLSYLEGRNILVMFDGSKEDLPGLLFSAHYDSSALAPGATDNGMSVAALLQVAEYFAVNQPKRRIILNLNNGEEDGLNGSKLFVEHPWAKLVDSFVNLEGAGSGGKAAVFQSSSPRLTSAFSSAKHPHGSVLFSDVFHAGVIRSTTDYQVYTSRGNLTGVDYAFYTNRHKYHTMSDTIPALHGEKSLWSMVENIHHVAVAAAGNTRETAEETEANVVYFDIFGETFLVLKLTPWLILNIVLVVLGPLLVVTLGVLVHRQKKLHWGKRGWGRFFLAFVIGAASVVGITLWIDITNSATVYRNTYTVLLTLSCFAALMFLVPLWLADWWHPVRNQRSQVHLETWFFWWILTILNIVLIAKWQLGGLYFLTFVYAGSTLATALSLVDMMRLDPLKYIRVRVDEVEDPEAIHRRNEGAEAHNNGHHAHHDHNGDHDHDHATERTPLIPRAEELIAPKHFGEDDLSFVWILEFLLAVPFPVILLLEILMSATAALSGTIVDGSRPMIVYMLLGAIVFLVMIPLAPYAHRLPLVFYLVLLGLGIISIIYNLIASPFSPDTPYKAFFLQNIDLDRGNNTVQLHGLSKYLSKAINEIPSYRNAGKQVHWFKSPGGARLGAVEWEGPEPRVSQENDLNEWLDLSINSTGIQTARFTLTTSKDTPSRYCYLTFGKGLKLKRINVLSSNKGWLDVAPSDNDKEAINMIKLWSRDWNRKWVVDVEWLNPPSREDGDVDFAPSSRSGRAACVWSERSGGKLPALDELFLFLPNWATLSAARVGLLEGSKSFSV